TCPPKTFLTGLTVEDGAQTIGTWEDGTAAAVANDFGKGRAILLGAPLGEIYFQTHDQAILNWLSATLKRENIEITPLLAGRQEDLRARRLICPDGSEILFVINYRTGPVKARILARGMTKIAELSSIGAQFEEVKDSWRVPIPSQEVLIAKASR
ncbi:MAG: hypothetical protein ACYSWU_25935, partial [Planctomycetota bacterium]